MYSPVDPDKERDLLAAMLKAIKVVRSSRFIGRFLTGQVLLLPKRYESKECS